MSVRFWRSAGCFGASYKYLLRHRCEYTTGFLERGCGREATPSALSGFETKSEFKKSRSIRAYTVP